MTPATVNASSTTTLKQDATFVVRHGLADSSCYSFESRNFPGHFLRHSQFRLRKDPNDGTALFAQDATFCADAGRFGSGDVTLEGVADALNVSIVGSGDVRVARVTGRVTRSVIGSGKVRIGF